MPYISPRVSSLIYAVRKASMCLSRDFCEIEHLQTSVRGHSNFVLSSYTRISRFLQIELQKIYPHHQWITDIETLKGDKGLLVSPIDGLNNYARGVPNFAVSVAVLENGAIVESVVYNPATDNLYFAKRGEGAYKEGVRNQERLRVSSRKEMKDALVGTQVGYHDSVEEYDNLQRKIVLATDNLRISGCSSLDLASVAAGKLDAFVSRGNKLPEYAAGILLVKEAGGYVFDMDQEDKRTEDTSKLLRSGNLLAVNSELSRKFCELFSK